MLGVDRGSTWLSGRREPPYSRRTQLPLIALHAHGVGNGNGELDRRATFKPCAQLGEARMFDGRELILLLKRGPVGQIGASKEITCLAVVARDSDRAMASADRPSGNYE